MGWLKSGHLGVDLFFVLSGFLITALMLNEYNRDGKISIRGFYRRRVFRLLPPLVLFLAALTEVLGQSCDVQAVCGLPIAWLPDKELVKAQLLDDVIAIYLNYHNTLSAEQFPRVFLK